MPSGRLAAAVAFDTPEADRLQNGRHSITSNTFDLCSTYVALLLAQTSMRTLMPPSTAGVDMLVLTNTSRFSHDSRTFLESRGVRIVDALQSPAMTAYAEGRATPNYILDPFDAVCMYRMQAQWMTEYEAIMTTDLDALQLPQGAHSPSSGRSPFDELGTDAITYSSADHDPIQGSFMLVRPRAHMRQRFEEAIARGFSTCSLWGGNYSTQTIDRLKHYSFGSLGHCGGSDGPDRDEAFNFQGAATDQGMLAHFKFDERYRGWSQPMSFDPSPALNLSFSDAYTLFFTMGEGEGSARMAYSHFAGGPKPWDVVHARSDLAGLRGAPDAQLDHYEMRHRAFWGYYWPRVIAPALRQRQDNVCSRAYEERRSTVFEAAARISRPSKSTLHQQQAALAPGMASLLD